MDVGDFLTHIAITFKINFEPGWRGFVFVSNNRRAIAYWAPCFSS